ncbi:MAG: amidohydrolase [Dysgonamonadaceae bacterium]|nr:amidohydrolase [Dysgonamonadaceae bacterium]
MKIIDAHTHLWLLQNTEVNGSKIQTLTGGRSLFMGEIRQMLPPFIVDGRNTAEILISNMDYAQVSAAVVTQEYIDGMQNKYLRKVQQQYPNRLLCCGLVDARRKNYRTHAQKLIKQGFKAIKLPAEKFITADHRIYLTSKQMMSMFHLMEDNNILLSIDLHEGNVQVSEMKEIIAECPQLKIAIGHFAMVTRKGWKEQLKLALNNNVYIESGGITWLFNSEFYPFKGAVKAIREAASTVGMEKLMWGSDYPRTITAITYRMSYDFILKSNMISEEEKMLFLSENAAKFYNFRDLVELPYIKNMSE